MARRPARWPCVKRDGRESLSPPALRQLKRLNVLRAQQRRCSFAAANPPAGEPARWVVSLSSGCCYRSCKHALGCTSSEQLADADIHTVLGFHFAPPACASLFAVA